MARKRKAENGRKKTTESKTPAMETTNDKNVENYEHPLSNNDHISNVENVENENLVENGKGEPDLQQGGSEPIMDNRSRSLGEKVSGNIIDDHSAGLSYKSMYIRSQKMVEELMAENCRLTMKLEYARGKLEVYEKMSNTMNSVKDMILVDSMLGRSKENTNGNAAPEGDLPKTSPTKNDSSTGAADTRKRVQRKKN